MGNLGGKNHFVLGEFATGILRIHSDMVSLDPIYPSVAENVPNIFSPAPEMLHSSVLSGECAVTQTGLPNSWKS